MSKAAKFLSLRLPFLFVLLLVLAGCGMIKRVSNVTYYVPEDQYLLKKNEVVVVGSDLDKAEVLEVLRQQPNMKSAWIKWRLVAYNAIKPEWVDRARARRLKHIKKKNARLLRKEIRVNERKRARAIRKGRETYFYRSYELKDTLSPRPTFLEKIKYKMGEPPVIVDTFQYERSKKQLSIYMHKHGYFYDSVSARIDTVNFKRRKINAVYTIHTGPRYYIDSFYIKSGGSSVTDAFRSKFLRKVNDRYGYNEQFLACLNAGKRFSIPYNEDVLGDYRNIVAKFMRDETFYGFSSSHISFQADTMPGSQAIKLGIIFLDRQVRLPEYPDSLVSIPHRSTHVSKVVFHICDTTLFDGNFRRLADSIGLELKKTGFLPTVDTFYYETQLRKAENYNDGLQKKTYLKSRVETNLLGKPKDSLELNPFRMATFEYNGDLFVQAGLLEAQNYLEYTNYYKEYYLDRTYNRLLQLGLFSVIKPEIIEDPRTALVEVHYYLIPSKKQVYSFQPRATNSNGFLGVSASLNYSNINLFQAGWLTTVSLSGGFESQPPIFDQAADGNKIKQSGRSFNTFEIGPSLKFDLPGFLPINVAKLPKRARPRTVLSAALNYQRRPDFTRSVFQMNYIWKLYVGKTQVVSAGLPFMSVIKFVSLNKSQEFEARIKNLNDLFLRNAYSNQLIWEDFKLMFEFDNREKDVKISEKLRVTFNTTLSFAGNTLSLGRNGQPEDSVGHKKAFGVTYSQFGLLDSKLISYYTFSKKRTLAMRLQGGLGVPYGNLNTSLPYDYSFFAGGANDNRGYFARSLGPGSYKYYMDTNRTVTQIGDIYIGGSLEFRFGKGLLQSAIFADAGNIWTFNEDINRPGSQFSKDWYRELGFAVGYGLRVDFEFFVVRCDIGVPLTNPAMPKGARWIFNGTSVYEQEISTLSEEQRKKLSAPYAVRFNVGIGFPF